MKNFFKGHLHVPAHENPLKSVIGILCILEGKIKAFYKSDFRGQFCIKQVYFWKQKCFLVNQ